MLAGRGLRKGQAPPNPTHNTLPQLLPQVVCSLDTLTSLLPLTAHSGPALLVQSFVQNAIPKGRLCAGHSAFRVQSL